VIKVLHEADPAGRGTCCARHAFSTLLHRASSGSTVGHDRRPWFATELVEGPSIKQLFPPGAIDRVDAIALLRDIAEILEHAFRRGVIHCGIRPERILMTGRTRGYPLCIVDWSDARTHDAKLQQFLPSEAAWHYTSPELACGDPIDDRTDVFALGVIAYRLLTGGLPFDDGIIATVDDGTTQHVPTEICCPDAPPELTKLVDSMLAYDRWTAPTPRRCSPSHRGLPTRSPRKASRARQWPACSASGVRAGRRRSSRSRRWTARTENDLKRPTTKTVTVRRTAWTPSRAPVIGSSNSPSASRRRSPNAPVSRSSVARPLPIAASSPVGRQAMSDAPCAGTITSACRRDRAA
jgi:serine/threonine-protein kinase